VVHHLDSATGEPEGHRPQRPRPRPIYEVVERGDDKSPVLASLGCGSQQQVALATGRNRSSGRADYSHSKRPLLPFVDEADGQYGKEHDHRPEAEGTQIGQSHCPGKEESDFQVENDEQNCDEVIADIEADPGIVKWLEAAFVGDSFATSGRCRATINDAATIAAEMPPAIARNTRIGK